jgi:ATP-binding cassette, subfamily B, bacterial
VLAQLRGHWPAIGLLLLVDLLATPALLLLPVPLKVAVDSVLGDAPLPGFLDPVVPDWFTGTDLRLLFVVALLQILIVGGGEAQRLASYVLHTRTGERITLGFRARLFRHAQRLSLPYHDQRGPTDTLYRIEYDAPAVQHLVDGILPFVSSTVMLVATVVVTWAIDPQLALVAMVVGPVLYWLTRRNIDGFRRRYHGLKELEAGAFGVVQEVLSVLRVVKAFGREDAELRRYEGQAGESLRARVQLSMAEGVYGLLINLTTATGTALVLLIGVRNVQSGRLTLGELLIVIAYLAQLYGPLKEAAQKVGDLQESVAGAQRAFDLLDEQPEVPERVDPVPLHRAEGRITFEDVAFSYEPGCPVLDGLSVRLEPGARLGIAGRTGAGKSTMVSLLLRFYDPTAGRILLDGVDLRDYRLEDLRRQLALVLQDPVLLSTSIAENIAYARPGATRAEIIAAAKAANAHHFITAFPDGYATRVGERGQRLSGGERQRISIARAFLKDAPILVLDEPTSSVDVTTEGQIIDAMERLMTGRTTIMIAHRLSTLDVCDARIDLEQGRIGAIEGSYQRAQRRVGAT